MPNSNEMRRLASKWKSGSGWPKRLEHIDIRGLRGWIGQRFEMRFPIMAVVGENGVGKSTVLQCAAAAYRSTAPKFFVKGRGFASDFFPKTAWDVIGNDAQILYSVREGGKEYTDTVRKPGERWHGNVERRERAVVYIDLSRVLPIPARVGYSKIAKSPHKETTSVSFDEPRLARLSQIMGRPFDGAKMAVTNIDAKRPVPVLAHLGATFSGFHQGAGETTIAELLQTDLPRYSLVLIDEIETSLHPRSQRRLIRDLAERCRELECQIILTTHSPYILDELPLEARAQIVQNGSTRTIVYGVSPEFAMTRMDDVIQHECDLFVEDPRAKTFLTEILARSSPELVQRCQVIAYGAASVGTSLGIMASQGRFPRPSCVFLDGDQSQAIGCNNLPGGDAPEQVVFNGLRKHNWSGISIRVGREFADVADACDQAMVLTDHHEWVRYAANKMVLASDILWHALCAEWVIKCLAPSESLTVTQPIEDALLGISTPSNPRVVKVLNPTDTTSPPNIPSPFVPVQAGVSGRLFGD
jgi:predicted ATPase